MNKKVAVIMGSESDVEKVRPALNTLKDLEIPYTVNILSAHRCTDETLSFARLADKEYSVIICAAGKAAHLAGLVAANTLVPVIGIPISSSLSGIDALLSTVQMPGGIPVACVAIDGSKNAALLSAQILSLNDSKLKERLAQLRLDNKNTILQTNIRLRETL